MNIQNYLETLSNKISKREKILFLITIFILSFAISINQTLNNAQYAIIQSKHELLENKNILNSIIDSNITTTDLSVLDNEVERLKQEIQEQNQQINNLQSTKNEIIELREISNNLNIDAIIEKADNTIHIKGHSHFKNIMNLIEYIDKQLLTLKIQEFSLYPERKIIIFNITITILN